jgi:GNAT superfamily N-acetyltransferase
MDPITTLDPQTDSLLSKYLKGYKGVADVTGALAHGLGSQVLSGYAGITALPHGMDAAAKAVDDAQAKWGVHDLSPEGINAIKSIAPAYRAISTSPVGQSAKYWGDQYDQSVNHYADLASKYAGPTAGGAVAATGAALPQAFFPEGAEGKAASSAIEGLPSAAAASTDARGLDNATIGAIEREGEAARRSNDKTPRQISSSPGYASHLSRTVPDDATVYTATHPETGEILGHAATIKRNGAHQMFDIEVNPGYQRQGIGSDLFNRAVAGAHDEGLPFHGDTQVTPEQMANAARSGHTIEMNPNVAEEQAVGWDPKTVLKSTDGQPVYKIHAPTAADDAEVGEPAQGSWIANQAYAEGGEVGTVAGGLGDLINKFAPLKGMPAAASIPGHGTLAVGPNETARAAALAYAKESGIPYTSPSTYAKVDPARGKAIAGAFEAMPHNPTDPATAASYQALIDETKAQYQHMKNAGVNVEFMPHGEDPYAASPRLMAKDVADNNHMYVYPTSSGFGGAENVSGNPLLGDSGETFYGQPATHNDLFRAVHDYFGHAKEGVGFRANGEENAWRQHAGMYSDAARPAMTTETRGQNSWVNFGPHGEANQTASGANTVFAPQKTGLLPPEFSEPEQEMHFLHMSNLNEPDVTLDASHYGSGLKGAEAKRGGTKVISLYPHDINPADIEQGLQDKTPYRVSVPKSSMYDMSNDPLGLRSSAPSYSDAEDAVRDAGFAGYHAPDGQGILRGQGRLFGPTPATRLGPGATPAAEEDLSAGFAEGGEVGTALGGLGSLIEKYAPEAGTLSDIVKDKGTVTYNPTTGDVPRGGYVVPTEAHRSAALDAPPSPQDFHDYLLQHQDAFDEDPNAVLHVHSDPSGAHFMHVAHYSPDFGSAADTAGQRGLPGIADIATGETHPAAPPAADLTHQTSAPDPDTVAEYLQSSRQRTPWVHGQQTVENPQRNAFPGIYNDPRQVIADSAAKVGPEDPLLQQLFGVSRSDLSDLALSRQGNELGVLPGTKANPRGAASAQGVMTPANEQRLIDVLGEAKNSPELYKGMTGWYSMDPLYQRFVQIFGEDLAPEKYKQFNTLSGMASPGSDVASEIARGTGANWLQTEGRFQDFIKHGGGVDAGPSGTRPADMLDLPGHVYHRTAQAVPMEQYLRTGEMQMKSPKVPMYIQASGVPQTGFQTDMPVGDAHWARGVGLADTRGTRTSKGQEIVPGSSVSTPEMDTLGPWWRNRVAGQVGLESVPAQALAWGAFSPYTGVKSAIGAPKLEILSTQIGKLAQRLGVSPETARDLVISGKAGAFSDGGSVE